jgi:penicillin-binding protein 2
MARDTDRFQVFSRRAVLLGGLQLGLLGVLSSRLYYLQVLKGAQYQTQAEENRVNMRLLPPPRGQILDRNGVPLAINQQNYRLVLLPEQVDDLKSLLDAIQRELGLSDAERKKIERDLRLRRGFNSVLVRDNLSWDQVANLSLKNLQLPGTDIESGEVRTYPYGDVTAHIIGFVGAVSEKELKDDEPELTVPGFRIGKNGVERFHDLALRGEAGNLQLEVNAHGAVVRELTRHSPKTGLDVSLTIDIGLQQYVQQRVTKEQSAAVVAMNVQTGAIHAMVSHPAFDPNLFTYGIRQDDWDKLNGDERAPLVNKPVSGLYAPGSTFKIVTALAALDAGLLNPAETVFCPGHYMLGNHRFHCWKQGGHGYVDFLHAMAGSCDTYFYDLGKSVGIDRISAMAKRLGFGQKLGIDMPHERAGTVPDRAWKQSIRRGAWQQGETLITAIGQGYLHVTPLQLALMTARVVNGGLAVVPHVTARVGSRPTEPATWPSLGIAPQHLALVRQALAAVVTQPIGTAYGSRIKEEGMAMGGKTGTAQVRRISLAERESGVISNDALPWRQRDHALFVGYAPVNNPRYAVSVIIEHGGGGSHVAAPIARDILLECQKRNLSQ